MSLRLLTLLVLLSPASGVHAQQAPLPVDIQLDVAIARLETAISAQDHAEVLRRIEHLRELDPSMADGELLYYEAVAAHQVGDVTRAERALNRFLIELGRQSTNYNDAIALLIEMEPKLEARAQAERIEAERLRAEEERRIAAQENAIANAQGIQEENALNLSVDDLRHIRWILAQFHHSAAAPIIADTLTDADRNVLQTYLRQNDMPQTRYLDAGLLAHFRSKAFVPGPARTASGTPDLVAGDWKLYGHFELRSGIGNCRIESAATDFTPQSLFIQPLMALTTVSGSGHALIVNLAFPNPFDTAKAAHAVVDGERFALAFEGGALKQQSDDVLRAIRAGTEIIVEGTSAETGQFMAVTYSAAGFTRAFNAMAELCGRPDILNRIS